MKNINKAIRSSILFAAVLGLFTLISCNNLLSQKALKDSKKGAIVISLNDVNLSRTVLPSTGLDGLSDFVLWGKRSGETNAANKFSATTVAQLCGAPIEIEEGAWTLQLKAKNNGINFESNEVSVTVTEHTTTPVSFVLDYADTTNNTGTMEITVTFNDSDTDKVEVSEVRVTLELPSQGNSKMTETIATSSFQAADQDGYKKFTYTKGAADGGQGALSSGIVNVTFDFYSDNLKINTLSTTVILADGFVSKADFSVKLNNVYTITYIENEGTLEDYQTQMTKFTSKNETLLPVFKKDGYNFFGWCRNEDCSDEPIMVIPKNTTTDMTLYAKFVEDTSGGVLLTNGTIIAYDQVATKITTAEDIASVVGIVYAVDEQGNPKGVVGLKNSAGGESIKIWAKETAKTYKVYLSSIFSEPADHQIGGYATSGFFEGDTDGSDNWAYICCQDPVGTSAANVAENYPAFDYVNNYGTNIATNLSTTAYKDGWYMPSLAELCDIYKNKDKINDVINIILTKVPSADVEALAGNVYWSSSQSDYSDEAWAVDFQHDGSISGKFKDYTRMNTSSTFSVCCVHTVNPVTPVTPKYTVNFDSSSIPDQKVQSGECANQPELSIPGYTFVGWYTDPELTNQFNFTTPITSHTFLYGKWTNDNATSLTLLPAGTDGTAGTSGTYVLFGDWPQTIKRWNVKIDEKKNFKYANFNCYIGSDGCTYVKSREANVMTTQPFVYSDGTIVDMSYPNGTDRPSARYFKLEPIKWRVVTEDYNSSGKALLVAESAIIGGIEYFIYQNTSRDINSKTILENNYKYSTIRAYLNGSYEDGDTQPQYYAGKGFLQTAFTPEMQSRIAVTSVDNSAESTQDVAGTLEQSTDYCDDTSDKIFLLSLNEMTTAAYGFTTSATETDASKIRSGSDYVLRSGVSGYMGVPYMLRSPDKGYGYVRYFDYDGTAAWINGSNTISNKCSVISNNGVVPALTISLND